MRPTSRERIVQNRRVGSIGGENDVDKVICRAKKSGVKKFIVPSSNLENSKKAIMLSEKYPEVYAAVGLHPAHGSEVSLSFYEEIAKLLLAKKVVAVGEVGLDYYYFNKESKYSRYPSKEEQQAILRQMIKLAGDVKLPLILHCREAYSDLLSVLKQEGVCGHNVIHCFMGSKEEAKEFLNLGFYLSFCGNITFDNKLDEIIDFIPLEKILIETDSPYLAPVPHRGERNEPAFLIEIARKVAKIKDTPLVSVEMQTEKNAEKLFNLKEI